MHVGAADTEMEIGPRHVRGLPAPPRRPVLRDKIALAGPEKPDCASATSLLLYSRDGAGPPERVKAGQGLTGSARAPGAVPDGVRDSFTPWSPLQSSPRACGSVGIARRPRAWVLELLCGVGKVAWRGRTDSPPTSQGTSLATGRPLFGAKPHTICVWVLGGQGETTPYRQSQ